MKELIERINDLESQVAFQDDTLHVLNETLVKQQQMVDLLEQKIQWLIKGHGELLECYGALKDDVAPPHY